jgi:hypothetical protein
MEMIRRNSVEADQNGRASAGEDADDEVRRD